MNFRLVEVLRSTSPDWVSSEVLRQPSGVSRAAVSKQIKALQSLGYEIESSPRKGYRLLREPDALNGELILPFLEGTRFEKAPYVYKEVTDSTNNDIRKLAVEGAPEGCIVFAEVQEQGRGRRGRSWFGRAGDSLQFSLLLRPPLRPQDATLIPLMAATSIFRALSKCGVEDVSIKWPNDVLIRGRKLCGVLCEMSVDMEGIQYAMLGIGMNVNTPGQQFPLEIMETACSLASETGHRWRRSDVLIAILKEMESELQLAWRGDMASILSGWREGAHTLGKRVQMLMPQGETLEGIAEDINEQGALLLRDDSGTLHTLHSGEVSLRPISTDVG
ncbi:biotin--[acetyl-CoA-carboxylase] ligase [Kiritimatiellota bacterium B12222]|nr:biotin--[acetyl-CoA-carboxylase] ligase [Kiritimatiellota bacterium B12222]